ncbi:MAG: tyrosine-type recombinase/integrase [Terriglobales bacterium]
MVKGCCEKAGLERIAPHDLRRTCAKLCHSSGGEIEQIQFLLGHASVQTTERYLGCKQNLGHPVNDRFNLATVAAASAEQPQSASMQATGAGDTIRRGDCDHGHPADSKRLFEDARHALVTEGEGHCASSLRLRPASGVGSNHPRSEVDGSADQRARRAVGT